MNENAYQSVEEFLKNGGEVEELPPVAKPNWAKQCTGGSYSVANQGRKKVNLKANSSK